MTPDGMIIHASYYLGGVVLSIQSVKSYSDNEFDFVTGYHTGTCVNSEGTTHQQIYPVIGKMDSLGNVLALTHYELTEGCQSLASDLEINHDKSVITWGSFFVLKADSSLAHVWSKHFDVVGGFQFIKELPDGDLLAGINILGGGAAVARLDAAGNFLWCKSYIRPRGVVQDCIIESDDSYIITGYTDSIASTNGFAPLPSDFHPKLFLMKLDGTGAVQWCKGYESTTTWYTRQGQHIVKATDGNYVLLANLNAPGYNLPIRPFLLKTDTNGDTLWTRSAGVNGYGYWTSNLLASSDGGILYDGEALGNFWPASSASFLFKTDSLGHLPCSEAPAPPLTVSDLFPTDSSFILTSVDGATAYPAFVQDTTYDAITTYDGCTITSVQNPIQAHHVYVHPNPSTGQFTVEFTDPLTVDSFYSVNDATGRLLFQRPLVQSAEKVEIDLSRYGKGLYLIRFSDRDGVCAERVVVE